MSVGPLAGNAERESDAQASAEADYESCRGLNGLIGRQE